MKFHEVFESVPEAQKMPLAPEQQVMTPARPRIAVWHRVFRDPHQEKGECQCGRVIVDREEMGGLLHKDIFIFDGEILRWLKLEKKPPVYFTPPSRFCVPCYRSAIGVFAKESPKSEFSS